MKKAHGSMELGKTTLDMIIGGMRGITVGFCPCQVHQQDTHDQHLPCANHTVPHVAVAVCIERQLGFLLCTVARIMPIATQPELVSGAAIDMLRSAQLYFWCKVSLPRCCIKT